VPSKGTLHYLESLRGIAALVVVLNHVQRTFYWEFCPQLLLAGGLAVRLFFVLSGFVLSISYFRKRERSVVYLAALKRYPRLMLPVCASVLTAWAVIQLGAVKTKQAALEMQQPPGTWLFHEPSHPTPLRQALYDGTIGTFVHGALMYNTSLWTMATELAGSFFIFAFLLVDSFVARRWLLYLGVGLVCAGLPYQFSVYALDFLAGLALCDFFVARETSGRSIRLPVWLAAVLCLVGVALGGVGVHDTFVDSQNPATVLASKITTLGCLMIVAPASFSSALRGILEHSIFALLGRVSFPLYLFHTTVIGSLGCGTYLALRGNGVAPAAAGMVASGGSVLASLLVAWLAYYVVERPSIRLSGVFGRFCLGLFQARSATRPR
jgi:peptidoglycan/LPS O-acetylase OafA/YrhL